MKYEDSLYEYKICGGSRRNCCRCFSCITVCPLGVRSLFLQSESFIASQPLQWIKYARIVFQHIIKKKIKSVKPFAIYFWNMKIIFCQTFMSDISFMQLFKGSFLNSIDHFLPYFDPLPPYSWHTLTFQQPPT